MFAKRVTTYMELSGVSKMNIVPTPFVKESPGPAFAPSKEGNWLQCPLCNGCCHEVDYAKGDTSMTPTAQRIARGEKDKPKKDKHPDGGVGSSDAAVQALPVVEDQQSNTIVSVGPHKCKVCSNSYTSKNQLSKHLRSVHHHVDRAMPSSATTQHKAGGVGSSGATQRTYDQSKEHGTTLSERNKWSVLKDDSKDGPITHQATLHDVPGKYAPIASKILHMVLYGARAA